MSYEESVPPQKASPALGIYNLDPELVRLKIAHMIILHEYPLSMVEHDGFVDLFKYVCLAFKMVSRNTIRSDILKVYADYKEKTMKVMECCKGRIAITTDIWTATNQRKGYMTVTAHFIDEAWALRSRILCFMYIPSPHDACTLSKVLTETLMDWNIDMKLSILTGSKLVVDEKLFHMRCCAHILNLIVKDGLSIFKEGIERICHSISYWSTGPKRAEKFEETARQLKVAQTKKLTLDCMTRWNSTYTMLSVALPYKDVFARLKQRDSQYKSLPSEDDWLLAKELRDKLILFYKVTELFSGTKYPTANLVFPNFYQIKIAIRKWKLSDNDYIKNIATTMMGKFDKYWKDIHRDMTVATVLDPRYKFKLIDYYICNDMNLISLC